jgi:hypothetical protein
MVTMTNRNLYLTDEQYWRAVERLRGIVASSTQLHAVDSNVIGDKYTSCTWGLCSDERVMWPTPDLHLWPDQFTKDGRIAPKYREDSQMCPMDKRSSPGHNGCFYTCRIFNGEQMSRGRALALIDAKLATRKES